MDDKPSASPSPSTSSRLLNLPLELLDAIFAHVNDVRPPFQPLCRQLEPVQRRHHYRRIEVDEYAELARLCRAASTIPGLQVNVVELKLAMAGFENDEHDRVLYLRDWHEAQGLPFDHLRDPDSISHDEQTCPTSLLVDFVTRLTALRVLDLDKVDLDLVAAVLDADLADDPTRTRTSARRLARLEILNVDTTGLFEFENFDYKVAWLRRLCRLPKLRCLRLAKCDYPRAGPPLAALDFSSPSLLSICVGESDSLFPWDGPFLSQFAPNLERIDLADEVVLKHAPSTIRELMLTSTIVGNDPQALSPLDDFLARFVHLQGLAIAHNSFDPARLLPFLHSLFKFDTLALGCDTPTTDAFLDALLSGPTRLRHLRRLTLSHVTSSRRGGFVSSTWTLPDDYDPTSAALLPGCRWRPPSYPPGASEAGLRAALRSAEARGVVLEGTALGALDWNEAYAQERVRAVLFWAAQTGRWDRAREFVGEERAEAYRLGYEAGRGAR
ncbi:hypothetical protein JCM9279_000444 [Rhodotorula babjevae]